MRFAAPLLLVATIAAVSAPVAAQTGDPLAIPADAAVSTVIVELGDNVPVTVTGRVLDFVGGAEIEVVGSYVNLGLLALDVTAEGAEMLALTSLVESVAEARSFELFLDESVPAIGVADLHLGGHTGLGRVVAILDSGIDTTRPALASSVVAEACFLQGTVGTIVEGCSNTTSLAGGSAIPCTVLAEQCSHGTHVAGIITSNDPTLIGVAPDVGLISIRVTAVVDEDGLGPSGPSTYIAEAAVLAGLDHVLALAGTFDIAAVNLSLGGDPGICSSSPWESAVDDLNAAGIAVVAASGNLGTSAGVAFPACLDDVIAVGATNSTPEVAGFTQYVGGLDLVAPGVSIDSTVLTSFDASGFASFSGTSMAAPHVASSFALIYDSQPGWSVARYTEFLRTTGVMITRPTADAPLDRDPRFPEIRPAAVLDFVPFADADFGFWVIASDWARATGVSTGPGGGVFDPDSTLTRAAAVTFLWRFMEEVAPTISNPFGDVPPSTWFTDAAVWAFEVGVTTGTGPGTFEPESGVTRGQIATFLWRLVGEPAVVRGNGFSDVSPSAFYAEAVDWMDFHGITTGTTLTTFSPDDVVTRAQMITFLWRLVNASAAWSGSVVPPAAVLF